MNDIKKKAIHSVRWTTISITIYFVTQIIQLSVLARILDKSSFGIIAIANVLIGFSQMFVDLGISNSIIHFKDSTRRQLSTLYWTNVFIGIIFFLTFQIAAPIISHFYKLSSLSSVLQIISITFLIQPFGQQYKIQFQKELKFKTISIIEIIAHITALFITILLAFDGYGVYSIVIGNLWNLLIISAFSLIIGSKYFGWPLFYFNFRIVKPYLRFGLFQMGDKIVNYFNTQFDTLLIGKILGAGSLGSYSIVKDLVLKPSLAINPIITKVTFPIMAKAQNDINLLKNMYLKSIRFLCSINMPIFLVMFIFAEPIVNIFLGQKWIESVYLLKILSLWAMVRSIANPVGSLLLSAGKADLSFYWNSFLLLIVPLSVYIGSYWGISGIAWSLLIFQIALIVPAWKFLIYRTCKCELLPYLNQIFIPLICSIIPSILIFIIGFNFTSYLVQFLALSIFFIFVSCLYWFFNREFISLVFSLTNLDRIIYARKK